MKEAFRTECPALEQLVAVFEKRLGDVDAARVSRHIDECPVCRAEWQALSEFTAASPEAGETRDVERIARRLEATRRPKAARGLRFGWLPKLAGALAAVALVAAIAIQWRAQKQTDLSGFESTGTVRSSQVIQLIPKGDLAQIPSEISWTSVPGAVSYEIVVSEVDGSLLWRGRTGDVRLPMPQAVGAALLPLKTLVCQVTAFDSAGGRLAQSESVRIRYSPGSSR